MVIWQRDQAVESGWWVDWLGGSDCRSNVLLRWFWNVLAIELVWPSKAGQRAPVKVET
jgi:hypothetical protein